MKLYEKIQSGQAYIIAEMSANHAGKLENALALVNAAKEAGADCIKVQTYTADTMTIDCDNRWFNIEDGLWKGRNLYQLYQEAYTPWEWQPEIKKACDKAGIDFLSTPFDETAVDFLENMNCEAYKIASFELVHIPLIEYAASKGKPMIISCGMGSVEEIQEAIDACYRAGNKQIILLKCCSEYPARWEDMHLANIRDMRERFNVPVGLSDHSLGSQAAITGIGLGACVIEKHLCLSRSDKTADSEFSMEQDEFRAMVNDIRSAQKIVGEVSYELTENEKKSMIFRRSIFATQDIEKGERFTNDNIRIIRPGFGLEPKYYNDILSMKAEASITKGMPISWDKVQNNSVLFLSNNENTRDLYTWLCSQEENVIHFSQPINIDLLKELEPRYVISFNYNYLIDKKCIDYMNGRIINLHISFLPYNRGWSPNYFSFMDNTPKGVTIHQIDAGLDTGAIYCQKQIHFDERKETFQTTYNELIDEITNLFKNNWQLIKSGMLYALPQTGEGTYHSKKHLEAIYAQAPFEWTENIFEYKQRLCKGIYEDENSNCNN